MKLRIDMVVNGEVVPAGTDVPWYLPYTAFLLHGLFFGIATLLVTYSAGAPWYLRYGLPGCGLLIYLVFYSFVFGADSIRWMLVNSLLGVLGTFTQLDWLLGLFYKSVDDYPLMVHTAPMLFIILYTFLLRQMITDALGAREKPERARLANTVFVVVATIICLAGVL